MNSLSSTVVRLKLVTLWSRIWCCNHFQAGPAERWTKSRTTATVWPTFPYWQLTSTANTSLNVVRHPFSDLSRYGTLSIQSVVVIIIIVNCQNLTNSFDCYKLWIISLQTDVGVPVGLDRACNPTFTSFFDGGSTPNGTVTGTPPSDAVKGVGFDWKSIASLALFIGCVLYSR